ncbi:hypothetical protein Btru_075327 [Bulinus truncatus]|nr:hypothetical protein Btru_075327 [Bulinus truncatus]
MGMVPQFSYLHQRLRLLVDLPKETGDYGRRQGLPRWRLAVFDTGHHHHLTHYHDQDSGWPQFRGTHSSVPPVCATIGSLENRSASLTDFSRETRQRNYKKLTGKDGQVLQQRMSIQHRVIKKEIYMTMTNCTEMTTSTMTMKHFNGYRKDEQYHITEGVMCAFRGTFRFTRCTGNIINIFTFSQMGLKDAMMISFLVLSISDLAYVVCMVSMATSYVLMMVEVTSHYITWFWIDPYGIYILSAMSQQWFILTMVTQFITSINATRVVLWISPYRQEVADVVRVYRDGFLPFVTIVIITLSVTIMSEEFNSCPKKFREGKLKSTINLFKSIHGSAMQHPSPSSIYTEGQLQSYKKILSKEGQLLQQVIIISMLHRLQRCICRQQFSGSH